MSRNVTSTASPDPPSTHTSPGSKSFVSASNLIGLAKTGLFLTGKKAPVNEVRFPAYEAKNPAVDSYLYVKHSDLPNVMSGMGISIISTSRGVLTNKQAENERVGGELLCEVW